MTLVIDETDSKKVSEILAKKFRKRSKNGNLRKHFGKLKRNIDGLTYQISMRENED